MTDAKLNPSNQFDAQSMATMLRMLFDENPDGVVIMNAAGEMMANPVGISLVAAPDPGVSPEEWSKHYGFFHEDGVTRVPPGGDPLALALKGQAVNDLVMFVKGPAR